MISILTCGYKPKNRALLEKSIALTVNYEYEFIYHDNRANPIGICAAYNLLAKQSKGNFICFVHEDVEFKTENWGSLFVENLKSCDVFGVAGGKYKASTPSGWSISDYYCANLFQYFTNEPNKYLFKESNPDSVLEEAVCLDGVLMGMKRNVIETIQFDEIHFKGFHGYDYDFSISASQIFKICIAKNISILHYSEGKNDAEWLVAQYTLHKKWKNKLPLFTPDLQNIDKDKVEFLAYKQCLYKMVVFKFERIDILVKFFKLKHLYYGLLYFFNKKAFNQIP